MHAPVYRLGIRIAAITLLVLASAVFAQPQPAAAGWFNGELQIRVLLYGDASKAYISRIEVSGENQRGEGVSHTWTQSQWTAHSMAAPGWWWRVGKSQRGVKVRLYLDGYGWRDCSNQALKLGNDPPFPGDYAYVHYFGQGRCELYLF